MLDFYVKTSIRFSLRDKRLFKITEVEITRVDCIFLTKGVKLRSFVKFDCSFDIFLNSANLICWSRDISKCFREFLRLRDNESQLYFCILLLKVAKLFQRESTFTGNTFALEANYSLQNIIPTWMGNKKMKMAALHLLKIYPFTKFVNLCVLHARIIKQIKNNP